MKLANVIQGQRVALPRNPATGILVDQPLTLVRAEDERATSWQVTLAPIFRQAVGPTQEGMVGLFAPIRSRLPVVRMTWGGGGVSWRSTFSYPVIGTSFSVAGDNIEIAVQATDLANVYTDDATPVVQGWVKPNAVPTTPEPLMVGPTRANPINLTLLPWCRALHVGGENAGGTIAVVMQGLGVTQSFVMNIDGVKRIPVVDGAVTALITPSAGLASVMQELVFT